MSSRVGVVVRPSEAAIVRRSVPKSRRSPLICVASWRTVMALVSGSGVWVGRIAVVIPASPAMFAPGWGTGWSMWSGCRRAPRCGRRGIGAALTWVATLVEPDLPAALIACDDGQPVYERMGNLRPLRLTAWHRPPAG